MYTLTSNKKYFSFNNMVLIWHLLLKCSYLSQLVYLEWACPGYRQFHSYIIKKIRFFKECEPLIAWLSLTEFRLRDAFYYAPTIWGQHQGQSLSCLPRFVVYCRSCHREGVLCVSIEPVARPFSRDLMCQLSNGGQGSLILRSTLPPIEPLPWYIP